MVGAYVGGVCAWLVCGKHTRQIKHTQIIINQPASSRSSPGELENIFFLSICWRKRREWWSGHSCAVPNSFATPTHLFGPNCTTTGVSVVLVFLAFNDSLNVVCLALHLISRRSCCCCWLLQIDFCVCQRQFVARKLQSNTAMAKTKLCTKKKHKKRTHSQNNHNTDLNFLPVAITFPFTFPVLSASALRLFSS